MTAVLFVAANTPGQVRGPKKSLLPHPRRTHRAVTIFRMLALDLGVALVVVTLAELSTRSVPAWREHPKWNLIRGRANNILANGRLMIGNAFAERGLEVVDGLGLRYRYAFGIRKITMPVRLFMTPAGGTFADIAVHVPTKRAASAKTRRRIVEDLAEYARTCALAGIPCGLSGDWNGADEYLPDFVDAGGTCDVQGVYGVGLTFVDGGKDPRGAGESWDHTGIAWAVAEIPDFTVESAQRLPAAA